VWNQAVPEVMGTVEALSLSLSLPLGILSGGAVIVCSGSGAEPAHGPHPSRLHLLTKTLLVLVYNLSKFEDPTKLCS
jgi:hypothetical protein